MSSSLVLSLDLDELSNPQHSTITLSTHNDKVASGGSLQKHEWHLEVLMWHQEVQFSGLIFTQFLDFLKMTPKSYPLGKNFDF